MTDSASETTMLPAIEDDQQQIVLPELVEEKGHPNAPQITLKCEDAFVVMDTSGDLLTAKEETGLFWRGTRFLQTGNLYLEGKQLKMLSYHVANKGNACQIDLTNNRLTVGQEIVEQGAIHVGRALELEREQLVQTITITSFHTVAVPLTLSLKVGADFCDLFEVRGFMRKQRGVLQATRMRQEAITLSYLGLDDIERTSELAFTPPSKHVQLDRISWRLHLQRNQPVEIQIIVKMREESQSDSTFTPPTSSARVKELSHIPELTLPGIESDDSIFNRFLTRGMHDLQMLSTLTPYGYYPYAGIPWFCCPFGRDALVTCLEFLPWFPQVTRGTLALLAAHQGKRVEPFTDEEPGKILHELRTGEMANCRDVPYIPYYGSIDSTPLFIITLESYIRWTNDQAFLEQLWPHAQAAAHWLKTYGDRDGDGFIEYQTSSEKGLGNQGWKDSWDAISDAEGTLASHPIAVCEVQGYAYAAYRAMAYLAGRLQHSEETARWEKEAQTLQEQFLRHFWWEDEQFFYLALNGAKKPCDIVSSNVGQCLWSGIVPADRAKRVMARLMRVDMYSGWGLRTISTHAARYNPMSYHNGSVWPHDTAMVGAGFAQYGGKAEASVLLKSLYEASLYFEGGRLPELYCGFPQRDGYGPTRYPVACSPQAWATGAPFMLVNALLGLRPQAESLILDRPTLPDWLQRLELQGMYLGERRIHLHFIRSGKQTNVVLGDENEVAIHML